MAPVYDRFTHKTEEAGLREMRRSLVGEATGRVLELGAGTGLNLPHYAESVESLVLTEPQSPMLRRLQDKAREQAPDAELRQAPAEELPFEDASFDTVVSTLVLCGADQERSLGEVRRVLRPGGLFLFLEHVRSDDPELGRFQDRMNWLNRLVVGCDCNRRTLAAIENAGFTVSRVEHRTLPEAPKFTRPLIVGEAVAGS